MTNCKVLSFEEIHTTNQFFRDCNECVNKNYRKNLELEEENNKMQQAKMDLMYWKKRAEQEQSTELVNMYERFQTELGKRQKDNNVIQLPDIAGSKRSLETPFNYEINMPSDSTPRGPRLSISELSGQFVGSSNGARSNPAVSLPTRNLTGSAPPRLNITTDVLQNSRAGLRSSTTRPASQAPASNTSDRARLINELTESLARRSRSRGSPSASTRLELSQLSSPSSSAISNASSVLANVAEAQPPRRGRPVNLTNSEVMGLVPGNARFTSAEPTSDDPRYMEIRIDNDPTSGSGLKKKPKKKNARKKNALM